MNAYNFFPKTRYTNTLLVGIPLTLFVTNYSSSTPLISISIINLRISFSLRTLSSPVKSFTIPKSMYALLYSFLPRKRSTAYKVVMLFLFIYSLDMNSMIVSASRAIFLLSTFRPVLQLSHIYLHFSSLNYSPRNMSCILRRHKFGSSQYSSIE